jgi:hypothetical protein
MAVTEKKSRRGGAGAVRPDWTKALAIGVAAWLVPGLGHWLLGRRGKSVLFLVMIWGTFLAGWGLSECRAVFWKTDRIATYAQVGAGALDLFLLADPQPLAQAVGAPLTGEPPYEPAGPSENLLRYYDVGTLYTSVAGLLNVVVAISAVSLALGWGPAPGSQGREDKRV